MEEGSVMRRKATIARWITTALILASFPAFGLIKHLVHDFAHRAWSVPVLLGASLLIMAVATWADVRDRKATGRAADVLIASVHGVAIGVGTAFFLSSLPALALLLFTPGFLALFALAWLVGRILGRWQKRTS